MASMKGSGGADGIRIRGNRGSLTIGVGLPGVEALVLRAGTDEFEQADAGSSG